MPGKTKPLYVQSVGVSTVTGGVNLWMGDVAEAETWQLAQLSARDALALARRLIGAAEHLLPTDEDGIEEDR